MLIISFRDNENNRWKRNTHTHTHTQRQKRTIGRRSYNERMRAKWFCYAFKLGFLQLIFKAFLIFKSNLQLAWSIILKQKELYKSKHVAVSVNV